jgi:hypothetical protein
VLAVGGVTHDRVAAIGSTGGAGFAAISLFSALGHATSRFIDLPR